MPRVPLLSFVALATLGIALAGMSAGPLAAQAAPPAKGAKRVPMTGADIEAATFSGQGDLPPGQSALTAKVQILLDRAGVSPGVIDGFRGGMSESALMAFERKNGLPVDGRLDPQVWALLQPFAAQPLTQTYTVTDEDAQGLVDAIPADYAEKAAMPSMGYTSIAEKLGEKFHMDDKFLVQLNPGVTLAPGAVLIATVPAPPLKTKVARIIVDKERGRVAAYDAQGDMVVDYPATVGSADNPSPHGTHTVNAVALDPNYTYNPKVNFKQGDNDEVLTIPPGPNGPVGNVWIDLSEPTYGIHGTPTPSRLFVSESHGCVRLTNWDARELAGMVQPRTTVVEFLAPGVAIADVTKPVAPAQVAQGAVDATVAAAALAAGKPLAKPLREGVTLPGGATLPPPRSAARDAAAAATAAVAAAAGVPAGTAAAAGATAGEVAGAATAAATGAGQATGPAAADQDTAAGTVAGAAPDPAQAGPAQPEPGPAAAADPLGQALSTVSGGALQPQATPYVLPPAGTSPSVPAPGQDN